MSFIGIVTRKEQDTGVTLEAKVVTKNKKKYSKKRFKVKVKANALDDFTCCVLDHATQVNRLNIYNEMDNIVSDITASMGYNGEHGTTISYKIINTGTPKLSDYMTENGALNKRPKFGEGNAEGYVEVIVTKNEAVVSSRIQVIVPSMSAEEVMSSMKTISESSLWALICKENDGYVANSIWSGHKNIKSQLAFDNAKTINTKELQALSNTPITITWSVEDATLEFASAKGLYEEPRIDILTGNVSRIDYKTAYSLVGTYPNMTIELAQKDYANVGTKSVRISGITLTATLTLGDAKKVITYDCATISKYLTNKEVLDTLLESRQLCLIRPDGSLIRYLENPDSNITTITAPAEGGTYTLTAYTNAKPYDLSTELGLGIGQIENVTISNSVVAYNGTGPYIYMDAFDNSGFKPISDYQQTLTILFDAFKDIADTEDRKFSCLAEISVSGYSQTGDKPSGFGQETTRYIKFVVDVLAMPS